MTSIGDARIDIQNHLMLMNLSPYEVKITGYDANGTSANWIINGEFQNGFLGETLAFEATYSPTSRSVVKFRITGKKSTDSL